MVALDLAEETERPTGRKPPIKPHFTQVTIERAFIAFESDIQGTLRSYLQNGLESSSFLGFLSSLICKYSFFFSLSLRFGSHLACFLVSSSGLKSVSCALDGI